jgi:hypothetical protein
LDRVKQRHELSNDAGLAEFLGVPLNTLRTWIKRNAPDWVVLFEKCRDMNYDYLVRGTGEVLREDGGSLSTSHCDELEKKYLQSEARANALMDVIRELSLGNAYGPTSPVRTKSPVG